ncbi:MAG: hypothetical protein FJ315_07270 [SAR202 cluster bacterium]|nr:hypothetical protein [SAR202 cluster bacterium]
MGLVRAEFIFTGLRQARAAVALVDTGGLRCVLPVAWAQEVGVHLVGRERLQLAEGRIVGAPLGSLWVSYGRPERRVLMSDAFLEADEPVVGVEALEGLGLYVDPREPSADARLVDTGRMPAQRLLTLTRPKPAE